ncbi:MAG: hydrogenase expression/formation protein HypE [Desulfovibrionaceae bacterium]|nr:hydrogenase expression/formation protein HypE [Desulfovibrionaceae bacterium]
MNRLLLDSGSGGRASQRLITDLFVRHLDNEILRRMDDGAVLDMRGPVVMSTDGYTVTPLFFPGGDIGSLAVHGTVNDVAVMGGRPRYLSCGFILEEGLELDVLERVVQSMAGAARRAGVAVVTGDTKVVPRGACDRLFITTTGVGELIAEPAPSGHAARPGDAVLLSGTVGDHGLTVMARREELSFISDVRSDSAPLNRLAERLITEVGDIHVLRDPTRGGLATTLNEIAEQSGLSCVVDEAAVPVRENVRAGCGVLGLDPLYLANEGKLICVLPREKADAALAVMRSEPVGMDAALVGEMVAGAPPRVTLRTRMGGQRLLSMLEGAPLPRIC